MIYFDKRNSIITDGFNTLRNEAEQEDAPQRVVEYYRLLDAIAHGKGFDFMLDPQKVYWITSTDLEYVLKELLYAIETIRVTDEDTHKNIVEETLENLLGIYA